MIRLLILGALLVSGFTGYAAFSDSFSSRETFLCGPDDKKIPYLIELYIDDVGDETGEVKVLQKSNKEILRLEEAYYKNGEFFFNGDTETVSIGWYDSFGDQFQVYFGTANIKEFSGSIHCEKLN